MSDTDTLYPSTEFDAEFNGCGAMSADFSGDLKIHVDDLPNTLGKIHALGRKKFKVMLLSDQAAIPEGDGNSASSWGDMSLQSDDGGEVVYEKLCIGATCPVLAYHTTGEYEGQHVCEDGAEINTFMPVTEESACPRYAHSDADGKTCADCAKEDCVLRLEEPESGMGCGGNAFAPIGAQVDESAGESEESSTDEEAAGETDVDDSETIPAEPETPKAARGAGVVIALYPGDDEPHVTQVGEQTQYAELVADYLAAARRDDALPVAPWFTVTGEDDGTDRSLDEVIDPDDYGKRLVVRENEDAA